MADRNDPLNVVLHSVWELLRHLEVDLIPHRLDKVADHTGKRLTPPLAKLLLDELEANDWLRDTLGQRIPEGASPPLRAFLLRPPGWWQEMIPPGGTTKGKPSATVDKQIEKLRRERDEAKRRIRELRQTNEELEASIREERRLRRGWDHGPNGDTEEVTSLRARVRELEDDVAKLHAEAARLEERIGDLRRRRPERSDESGQTAVTYERGFGRMSGVALGRRLDLEYAALVKPSVAPVAGTDAADADTERSASTEVLRVPEGIAPDAAAAVDWLVSLAQPVLVVVDGYNVTYLMDPADFRSGAARRTLVGALAGLRRRLPTGSALEVVFDSAEGVDTDPFTTPAGVLVRYTATGVIADDDIVGAVDDSAQPVIVVSNDRELRIRSEEVGAVALWGDALVRWLAT